MAMERDDEIHEGAESERHDRKPGAIMGDPKDYEEEDAQTKYDNLDEVTGPPPDENPQEGDTYTHQSLERRRSGSAQRKRSKQKDVHTQLYTISDLIFFSFLGTLSRLGVQWLTTYPNAPTTMSALWPNVGGSFVLGFLQEDRALFAPRRGSALVKDVERAAEKDTPLPKHEDLKRKKALPLYIGLSVGYCGSFTSFSSFVRDAFLALSNDLGSAGRPRSAGWSVCSLLAVLITEIALSLSALSFGAHVAIACARMLAAIPKMNTHRFTDPLVVFFAFGCWLGAAFLAIWPPEESWRGQVVFALVFAPLGCLLRFYLSLKLNGISTIFPVGTFTANVFGTVILGMVFDLQHARLGTAGTSGGGIIGCQVLQGVEDGFSGCLTTVSTWVAELKGSRKRHAYIYGGTSVAVSLASLVIIIGALHWTVGLQTPICL